MEFVQIVECLLAVGEERWHCVRTPRGNIDNGVNSKHCSTPLMTAHNDVPIFGIAAKLFGNHFTAPMLGCFYYLIQNQIFPLNAHSNQFLSFLCLNYSTLFGFCQGASVGTFVRGHRPSFAPLDTNSIPQTAPKVKYFFQKFLVSTR